MGAAFFFAFVFFAGLRFARFFAGLRAAFARLFVFFAGLRFFYWHALAQWRVGDDERQVLQFLAPRSGTEIACHKVAYRTKFSPPAPRSRGDVGIGKPDPAIFRELLQRFGLVAESTVFIDDSRANVAVARSMGFDAIEFESAGQVRRDLVSRGFPLVNRRPDSP